MKWLLDHILLIKRVEGGKWLHPGQHLISKIFGMKTAAAGVGKVDANSLKNTKNVTGTTKLYFIYNGGGGG